MLLDELQRYAAADMLPMHMPGHKRNGAAFPWLERLGCGLDLTELPGFDNLNDPQGLFRALETRAASLWGAKDCLCLVGGSTAGLLAAVRTALNAGGSLLLFRGSHRSVYHAAELVGAPLYYLTPSTDPRLGVWRSVAPASVEQALCTHPDVHLVCLTSPTYEGVCSDLPAIAKICHAHGALLLVDAAHGAHFGFGAFPQSAVQSGADLVVQSLHKTLPALTQTALLYRCSDRVDGALLRHNVTIFQSSSPSYLLAASIDGCVDYLAREGDAAADRWLAALSDFRAKLTDLQHLALDFDTDGVFARDPSKIVLRTDRTTCSGAHLADLLRERFRVELEASAGNYALAMTGMGDTAASLDRFARALREADRLCAPGCAPPPVDFGQLPVSRALPGEALRAPGRFRAPSDAIGRVSGEYVWLYPPGAPLFLPGEVLDERLLSLLQTGADLRSTRGGLPDRIFCAE